MNAHTAPIGSRHLRRAITAWLALLVALMTALAPNGVSLTPGRGSAFSATTVDVGLSSASPRTEQRAQLLPDRDPAGPSPLCDPLSLFIIPVAVAVAGLRVADRRRSLWPPSLAMPAIGARAPPTSFSQEK